MRDYAKVSPQFWTGVTGKALRKKGTEAVLVAAYLMTAPSSNMLGLYYLPLTYIAHETGLPIEGASKGLQWAIEAGFCAYDDEAEVVWVYEMASYQIANQLKREDKRCIGIQTEFDNQPASKHLRGFYEKYRAAFHLTFNPKNASPFEAPSKPLRSQEQEQEQEQEQDQQQKQGKSAPRKAKAPAAPSFDPRPDLVAQGVGDQTMVDWLALRAKKRAPVTPTVLSQLAREAAAAGMSLDATLALCCVRGWTGFEAAWVQREARTGPAGAPARFNPTAHVNRNRNPPT
jgi:hypothetical protein